MAKRYLDVSYDDRELAKRLGAKWDPSVRRWYCPAGSPLAKIFKWRAEARLGESQKHAAEAHAGQASTDKVKQSPRINSDIHFKATRDNSRAALQPVRQPAINQNFELFMAS